MQEEPADCARCRAAEKRLTDIRNLNELTEDGLFAAFEQPGLFVGELRTLSRMVR